MPAPHPTRSNANAPRFPEVANGSAYESCAVAPPTMLQPRVAVVLGVPDGWLKWLFVCRLGSICPAIWFSLPIALRLLRQLHAVFFSASGKELLFEDQLRLTEMTLAMLWCGVSSYLSFFFTDCLMSRWLLNYTPLATIIRLVVINALNFTVTSWALFLSGGSEDPRLLLPAWIGIATTLTALYHITQRKINIHKETSTSIGVFSGASFFSMVLLLVQLHLNRTDYPSVPLITLARNLWVEASRVAKDFLDEHTDNAREL